MSEWHAGHGQYPTSSSSQSTNRWSMNPWFYNYISYLQIMQSKIIALWGKNVSLVITWYIPSELSLRLNLSADPMTISSTHMRPSNRFWIGFCDWNQILATQMVGTANYTTKNSSVTFDAPQQSSGIQPGLRWWGSWQHQMLSNECCNLDMELYLLILMTSQLKWKKGQDKHTTPCPQQLLHSVMFETANV